MQWQFWQRFWTAAEATCGCEPEIAHQEIHPSWPRLATCPPLCLGSHWEERGCTSFGRRGIFCSSPTWGNAHTSASSARKENPTCANFCDQGQTWKQFSEISLERNMTRKKRVRLGVSATLFLGNPEVLLTMFSGTFSLSEEDDVESGAGVKRSRSRSSSICSLRAWDWSRTISLSAWCSCAEIAAWFLVSDKGWPATRAPYSRNRNRLTLVSKVKLEGPKNNSHASVCKHDAAVYFCLFREGVVCFLFCFVFFCCFLGKIYKVNVSRETHAA